MRRLVLLLSLIVCAAAALPAQRQPQPRSSQREEYDRKFFDELRRLFGRFQDADLRYAFERAGAIPCSELINDRGEWKELAFFNEDRKLGAWYRRSIDEIKVDPAGFIFKGPCDGEHGTVEVTSQFPVDETVESYRRGRIRLEQIVVHTNAPVRATFDSRSEAYTFDLPYLYLVNRQGTKSTYTLNPPRLADRNRYVTDVIDRWSCKSVNEADVTYQFLICRTAAIQRDARQRGPLPFGASAYFILSDGKEASSSVRLVFNDDAREPAPVERPAAVEPAPEREVLIDSDANSREGWQIPASESKLVDVGKNEFRIRFSPQTWAGKVASPRVLLDQKLASAESSKPNAGADYCAWRPGVASSFDRLLAREPDAFVAYSVKGSDRDKQSSASVLFELKTHTGFRLGALQCYFPRADLAASVPFSRWVSVVGGHLTLEVRP